MTVNALKPAPIGLFGRGHLPPTALRPAFAGQWIQARWADLEKAPGVYDWEVLDAQRDAMLHAMPHAVARYRIFGGRAAPDYVLARVGHYPATDSTIPGAWPVALWWTPYYARRYRAFMLALALHIESDPVVVEVSAALTMSVFAEPLIRQMGDKATREAMLAAGYTWALDGAAVAAMVQIHADLFKHTHTGIALNPAQNVEAGKQDLAATLALIDHAHMVLGHRFHPENNSLDAAPSEGYRTMYEAMAATGLYFGFQTRGAARLPDPFAAVNLGISLGATSLEPNGSDFPDLSSAQQAATALQRNAAGRA